MDDELYESAVLLVRDRQIATTSLLQREFRIGYGRARAMLDEMERRGVITRVSGDPYKINAKNS